MRGNPTKGRRRQTPTEQHGGVSGRLTDCGRLSTRDFELTEDPHRFRRIYLSGSPSRHLTAGSAVLICSKGPPL